MRKLYIKKLHKDAKIPKYVYKGDVGFDLSSIEDCLIHCGGYKMVRTGLAIKLEYGYEMTVRQRSGLSIIYPNYIAIGVGTIDTSYRGEIKIPVINNRADGKSFVIKKGDRIAQGVVSPIVMPEIIEIEEFTDETYRGSNGFGSTGV